MKTALTIAGSDSGGGAGIQADLKTFHQFEVFGTTVITAVTAQNTRGVFAWEAVSPYLVRQQIEAVAHDLRPHAYKTGMLANAETVRAVTDGLDELAGVPYVLDPVIVATSGDRLLEADAVALVSQLLLPRATLVSPNIEEAAILTDHTVATVTDMEHAGRILVERGAAAALIKGGHLPGPDLHDVLVTRTGTTHFRHRRHDTTSTHGTGCTLAAAVTAGLARGEAIEPAVAGALAYIARAIAAAPGLGTGHGPLNHFVHVSPPALEPERRQASTFTDSSGLA